MSLMALVAMTSNRLSSTKITFILEQPDFQFWFIVFGKFNYSRNTLAAYNTVAKVFLFSAQTETSSTL